jgi:hypothetical protein
LLSAAAAFLLTLALLAPAASAAAKPAAGNASGAAHSSLTPVEARYANMVLRLLTEESPDQAAEVVVGMLKHYASPSGPTVPGCAVNPASAKNFRRLPVPSLPKWESLFKQVAVCKRAAGPSAKVGACTQTALDTFGLGTADAQRDLVHLFYCSMICEDHEGEGCEGGKDCNAVLEFDGCKMAKAAAKSNNVKGPMTAAGAALAAGGSVPAATAAKASSYYLLDSAGRR